MIKLKPIAACALLLGTLSVKAQQNASFQIYRTFQTATTLLNNGQYVAAAEQFRLIEQSRLKTTNQPQFESELSLIKENAQYYEALCALELGNDDALSLFQHFIKEHPENALSKLAYFQIGKSYSKQRKYGDAILWFNKIDAKELNGKEYTEYKFR